MDDRYKFVRGGPFDGLEDYASAPKLTMTSKKLAYPVAQREAQISFSGFYSQRQLNENLGYFFELLAQGIYGGQLTNRNFISPQLSLFTGREEIIQPDLIVKNGHYKEVKGCETGEPLKLPILQLGKYRTVLRSGAVQNLQSPLAQNSIPELEFEIFRHRMKKLDASFKTKSLEDMIFLLCSEVRYGVSLPARVIYQIYAHAANHSNSYVAMDNQDNGSRVKLKSRGQNNIIADTEKVLKELGFENSEEFEIIKYKFPSDVTVNGIPVVSFPFLLIKDRKHEDWVKELAGLGSLETELMIDLMTLDLPF
jgi:hypothetical protein